MGPGREPHRRAGVGVESHDPLVGSFPLHEGERSALEPVGIVGVGSIDRRERLGQVAHSESPTSATYGPVSSKSV